jgi:hypothetical protein
MPEKGSAGSEVLIYPDGFNCRFDEILLIDLAY